MFYVPPSHTLNFYKFTDRTHSIASGGTKKPNPVAGPGSRGSNVSTEDGDGDVENNNLSYLTLSQCLRREIAAFQGNYLDQEIFRKLVFI